MLRFLRSRRVRARATHLGRRVACALLALSLLLGVFQAGRTYLYCPMRDAIVAVHCCRASHDESTDDRSPAVEAPDCCQPRHVDALPAANANCGGTLSIAPAN